VLELGQIGLETDTGRAKMGDGTTIWSSLAYSDVAVRAYADALIAAEVEDRDAAIEDATLGLWDDRGNFDASVNTFPTTGGSGTAGAIKKGDVWLISVVATSGPLNGVLAGATIRALVDVPGQTGGNWATGSIGVDQPARDAAAAAQATADAALPAGAQAVDVDPAGNDIAVALGGKLNTSDLDTDGTMAANSDAKVPSQKATRTYVASVLAGVAKNKGPLDCSANPNYPAALNGDYYRCSVAGKVGGASGVVVEVADLIMCVADNAGGTQASVGTSWIVGQANIAGITAAGLAMLQAADAEAQAGLLDTFLLSLSGGTMFENAVVSLFNGSRWQQSTPDKGIAGTAGFSIICSAGYEYKFANGFLFVLSDGGTTVRKVLYAPTTPTATDDTTLGYTTDTTWEMADGTRYDCTDVTEGAAVWAVAASGSTFAPYNAGNLTGSVTLAIGNGGTQYGTQTGNVTIQPPSGTPVEKVSAIELYVTSNGGTLDFDAAIIRASDSAASFPKTLTNGLVYLVQLRYFKTQWNLTALVGGY
jgi:hypothetical protein